MTIHLSKHFTLGKLGKRTLVRIISFAAALVLVLSFMAYSYAKESQNARRALTYQYMKGMSDLSLHLQNIDSDLTKVLYTKTPELMATLSSKLWRESGFAKEVLTGLPVEYLKLQGANKFLSQVGDYCQSISKSAADGVKISAQQQKNLMALNEYSTAMLNEMLAVNDAVQTGSISLHNIAGNISHDFDKAPQPANITEGFSDIEEGFSAYPTLIYDGPFSDHVMQKKPLRLQNEAAVSKAQAKSRAAAILAIKESDITEGTDEESLMPSYGFNADGVDLSMTKKGGLLSYMLRSRMINEMKLSPEEAEKKAVQFLNNIIDATSKGKASFASTYYEIDNNVITFNFACKQGDVLVYPELIKIGVALDNGEIHSFDARGYIVNHFERDIVAPTLTKEQASQSVSDLLKIESVQRCIIPSDGLNELSCYEFLCKAEDEKQVLVYVNADTGKEERILILLIDENGQLTI